ncbi:hypothetical protein EAF04_007296 [Stromatinia cepivora]|nr:hypothetical protein EAF04_007296 [Stromatinia cepivora]
MAEKHMIDADGDCIFHLQRKTKTSIKTSNEHEEVEGEGETQNIYNDEGDQENNDDESTDEVEFEEVIFQVSSKHMMLASPAFKAMFQHTDGFKEGEELHTEGTVHVPLPDDNPDAFLILANIIHCRDAQIPQKLSLSALCDFAILVEKYCMQDAVTIVSFIWIKDLMGELHSWKVHEDAVLHWLCIAWVFNVDEAFFHITWLLALKNAQPPSIRLRDHDVDLPIPDTVIEKMDENRERIISRCFTLITNLITKYQNSRHCKAGYKNPNNRQKAVETTRTYRHECDSMMLGSILKGATEHGLFPAATPPFEGFSFIGIYEKIRLLKPVSPCDWIQKHNREGSKFVEGRCKSDGVFPELVEAVGKIGLECFGLKIEEFKHKYSRGKSGSARASNQ